MDTIIPNVAKKKGIRTGVVLAGYDLDRKAPTAVAASDFSPAAMQALTQRVADAEAVITALHSLITGYTGMMTTHGHDHAVVENGLIKSVS